MDVAIWKSRLQNWLWMESRVWRPWIFSKRRLEIVQVEPETVKTFMKWSDTYLDEMGARMSSMQGVEAQKAFGNKWYPYTKMFSLPTGGERKQRCPCRAIILWYP